MKSINFLFLSLGLLFGAPSITAHSLDDAVEASIAAPAADEDAPQVRRALASLNKIKSAIDAALATSTEEFWKDSDNLYAQVQENIAYLYLLVTQHPSPITNACMSHVEELLDAISELPVHRMCRNGADVNKWTQTTINNIQTASSELPEGHESQRGSVNLAPSDRLMQERATLLAFSIQRAFLPAYPIHGTNRSWISSAKESVIEFVEEHPYACTAVATAVVVGGLMWWYNKGKVEKRRNRDGNRARGGQQNRNENEDNGEDGGEDENDEDEKARRASEQALQAQQALANQTIQRRTKAEPGEYNVIPVAVEHQGFNTCTYHSVSNTVAACAAIEGARYELAVQNGIIQQQEVDEALTAMQQAEEELRTRQEQHKEHMRSNEEARSLKAKAEKNKASLIKQIKIDIPKRIAAVAAETDQGSIFQRFLNVFRGSKDARTQNLQQQLATAQTKLAEAEAAITASDATITAPDKEAYTAELATLQHTRTAAIQRVDALRNRIAGVEIPPQTVLEKIQAMRQAGGEHEPVDAILPSRTTIEQDKEDFIAYQRRLRDKERTRFEKLEQEHMRLKLKLEQSTGKETDDQIAALETELADKADKAQKARTNFNNLRLRVERLTNQPDASEDEAGLFFDYLLEKYGYSAKTLTLLRRPKPHKDAPETIQNNPDVREYYCGALDYGQNSMDYDTMQAYTDVATDNLEALNGVKEAIKAGLTCKEKTGGRLDWAQPDLDNAPGADMQRIAKNKSDLLAARELARLRYRCTYPAFLGAIQAGKPALLATLCSGHWTAQYYLPNHPNPDRLEVRQLNSTGGGSLSPAALCLIHDALHLRVPPEPPLVDAPVDTTAQTIATALDTNTLAREITAAGETIPLVREEKETYGDGIEIAYTDRTFTTRLPKGQGGLKKFILSTIGHVGTDAAGNPRREDTSHTPAKSLVKII